MAEIDVAMTTVMSLRVEQEEEGEQVEEGKDEGEEMCGYMRWG